MAVEPVTTRIESIGADGDGIGVLGDGTRFYVPLTVPGDLVSARPLARRGEAWSGELAAVLESGPGRRTPVCRHFGSCGGCATQHWDSIDYLRWKTDRLTAALRRAGYDDPPVADPIQVAQGTRRRMDLAVRRVVGGVTLGLHRARGGEVIDVQECAVLDPRLFALLAPLRAVLARLGALRHEASAVVNLLDSGPDVLIRTDAELITQDRVKLTDFARAHDLPRVSWALANGPTETVCMLVPPATMLGGVEVIPPPGAFLQAAREGEAAIAAAVLDGLPKKRVARTRVLELYAGCGTITFAVAAHLKITAMEGDEALVAACHAAINKTGLMGRVEIKRRDLVRQPVLAKEFSPFAAVILDPPHAGAAPQMPHIAQSKIGTVIYVSCDPVSLGRDAAVLHAAGYRLERVTPVDQFLWSARLEAVAVFRHGK